MEEREYQLEVRKYHQEWFKVFFSFVGSVALAVLAFLVQQSLNEQGSALKQREQILSQKQAIYSDMGRRLNIIYVYLVDVGDFGKYSPEEIVQQKREADRLFFMYRSYWSDTTQERYSLFMNGAFKTYTGVGQPPFIRTTVDEKRLAYPHWKADWEKKYFTKEDLPGKDEHTTHYFELVESLLADITSYKIHPAPVSNKN